MISKKRILRVIDIVFWTIIIVNVIFEISKALITGNISFDTEIPNMLGIREYLIVSVGMLFMFLFFTVVSLLKMFHLTIIYIGIRIAYKKYNREKLESIDFKNDSYYREIISKYSPGVLSYVDNFKLEEKDIVATLMSLELKKKIKIEDKIKLVDENEENLEENEKYILDKIKNNKIKDINILTFEKKVISDCINDGLLEEKTDIKKKIIKKILICVLIYALLIIGFNFLPMAFNNIQSDNWIVLLLPAMIIIFFAMVIFPFTTIVYIRSYYFMNKLNPYIRNKKAKDINLKLEGLRNYIKDYSLLGQKDHKDIIIWDNYLIYSVMLGQNTEIVDEIMKKVNEM